MLGAPGDQECGVAGRHFTSQSQDSDTWLPQVPLLNLGPCPAMVGLSWVPEGDTRASAGLA